MPASTYSGNALLNLLLRGVAFAAPSRVYVSLHIADPGLTGSNEVSTGAWPAYARQDPAAAAAVSTGFSAASAKATANAKQMLYAANTGASPVTITHFAIWDAATGGNCLLTGPLTASKIIAPTDECVIHVGELDVAVT